MDELIVYLELVRITAKQLHYSEKGDSFYGNHLLMDKISEKLYDFEDEIIESIFMADTGEPPNLSDIYSDIAAKTLKNPSKTDLLDLLKRTIYFVEEKANEDRFQGDFDLLGRISNNLRQSYGLLSRVCSKDAGIKHNHKEDGE